MTSGTVHIKVKNMAKSFACKNIGLACSFSARANDEQSLMKQVANHAKKAHNMQNIDDATMAKIKAAIKEA